MSAPANPSPALARAIGTRIARRVGSRVRGLVVLCREDAVIVRGRSTTYHAWQLVIAECRQTMAGRGDLRLDCVLRVDMTP